RFDERLPQRCALLLQELPLLTGTLRLERGNLGLYPALLVGNLALQRQQLGAPRPCLFERSLNGRYGALNAGDQLRWDPLCRRGITRALPAALQIGELDDHTLQLRHQLSENALPRLQLLLPVLPPLFDVDQENRWTLRSDRAP